VIKKPARDGFAPGLLLGLVLGAALAVGLGTLTGVLFDGDDDLVSEARETIEENYFESTDPRELEQASIRGMIDQLRKRHDDRFSHYFTPAQLRRFESSTEGRFSGVGLIVSEVPKGLRVARVYPNTPAREAGIEVGDVITEVEGKSIAGVASRVSTSQIKGPPGTEVRLTLRPAGGGAPRELTVERANVRIPAVDESEIRREGDSRLAHVHFSTFSSGSHGELRDAIERLYREGAEGLVLDLRGNGGGLLNEAILAASIFVEDGPIASTESRTRGERTFEAVGDAIEPRPTVVLVNRDTASASEILAAALKVNDLATVVGTRTFGKATVQEIIDLESGGALDLTVANYLTADGKSILGEGVKPQVRIEDDPRTEDTDEALDRALEVLASKL
jgi:carboxyl-terminal processing protease